MYIYIYRGTIVGIAIPFLSLFFGVRLEFMEGMRQLNYPASEIPQLFCDIDVESRSSGRARRR